MKHGISFLEVDNSRIHEAIKLSRPKDEISNLKQQVAFTTVYGFEYDEVSFEQLSHILSNDYGFNPFKYTSVEEGAIYDKEKHPNAWGRVRGMHNINNSVTWVCLDVDKTTITDEEMHQILHKLNHHICRTSDPDNPNKYRIILELSERTTVVKEQWKFFIGSIADSLSIVVDNLGASQVFYGYKDRTVYTVTDQGTIDPSRHLKMAQMRMAELEEKRASALPPGQADKALQKPFQTFGFAYDAEDGSGTNKLLAAIHRAKELGASKEYIVDMVHSINNFWDKSMPLHRLQSTVLTAI